MFVDIPVSYSKKIRAKNCLKKLLYCTECKSKYLSYFDKHLLNIFKEYEKVFLMAKNEFTDVEDTKYNVLKSLFLHLN